MNSRCPHIARNRGIALTPLTLPAVVAVFVKLENGVSRSLLFCAGGVLFERFHVLVSAGRLPITQIDFSTFRLLVPFEFQEKFEKKYLAPNRPRYRLGRTF